MTVNPHPRSICAHQEVIVPTNFATTENVTPIASAFVTDTGIDTVVDLLDAPAFKVEDFVVRPHWARVTASQDRLGRVTTDVEISGTAGGQTVTLNYRIGESLRMPTLVRQIAADVVERHGMAA